MKKIWPKVIRDPVHDIIPFTDTPCDRLLLDLINMREFQRLRRIKQLGLSELVFPMANHSRLSHAIGVMHIARRRLDQMKRLGFRLTNDQRVAALAAALLHDIGHGPFSHAFEKVTGDKHEMRTLQIICDESTEVNASLRKFSKDLPERLAVFFDESIDDGGKSKVGIPIVLTQIVSSQLDADRFDYLLRDSLATGTDYGRFDLNWLMIQQFVDSTKKRFYLSRKALSAAEAYVYARYHMYRSVYFHKATRAAEVMLRLLFKRYKELVEQCSSKTKKQAVVPGAPSAIFLAFTSKPSLDQYLFLDDHTMTEFFKACSAAKDTILRTLGHGLVNRALFKGVDASDAEPAGLGKFTAQATDTVRKNGYDPAYAFADDTAADTPYKPYDPADDKPATQIYVELGTGEKKELSQVSDSVAQSTQEVCARAVLLSRSHS